ncbi:hypothetical protein H310_06892 [Aphanomyces invadans]|uniref:Major facilitator superfamily (MFS) profile domain-containing protein n=1 Tax=Aphanomyces invadans TaxID=157072 RepID=A0A024U4K3_9STRA|nr:hypothetical protein H310_06892 [Aphanomyces invadans]ETW01331.1 hypothetical protein H310_06892 [Aphanomyces invadans]RHY24534.1 hypothetical protein DYB32_009655 [Aphanomyces invadans]|eukprot:XP_008870329.1 hypothetical protein H310_06892 [Aphanomyces invadans]
MSSISQCLARHWTSNPPVKTPEQIDAEQYLICVPWFGNRYFTAKLIPFNRWFLFVASFLCQFCCGSLYSWSIYNTPIDTYIYKNASAGNAVYTFYIACGLLGTTAALLGPWLERNGPRAGMFLGTSCFLIGYIIAAISLTNESMVGVYLGYGLVTGFGLGINYISPVSALQKWFPDMRGTAAGFAVGGFGAGSIVWGKVYLPAIKAFGLPGSFIFLGVVMSAVMFFCALCMRTPPPGFSVGGINIHGVIHVEGEEAHSAEAETGKADIQSPVVAKDVDGSDAVQYEVVIEATANVHEAHVKHQDGYKNVKNMSMIDCLLSADFFFMYLMLFGNIVFGLVVLSRLSPMATGVFKQSPDEGATVVSINGAFNCCGRLFVPMVSDFLVRFFHLNPPFARKCIFFTTLTTQVVILLTLPTIMRNQSYDWFRFEIWLLTLCYGGGFGTIPAFLTDMFGAYNIGALHGFILTAWSIAGVGGGLGFTFNFNHLVNVDKVPLVEAYIQNINWIVITTIVGVVALFGVRTNPIDRFAPGYQYSICGKPIIRLR